MNKINAFHATVGQTVTFLDGTTGTIAKIMPVRFMGKSRLEIHLTDGTLKVATPFTRVSV